MPAWANSLFEDNAEYGFGMVPPEAREEMEKRTFINGKRMDAAFGEALALVRANKIEEAAAILSVISEKIEQYFEDTDPKFFCFRNPFEYHMYRMLYPEDTAFERAPFDFAKYLDLYGFVLLEQKKTREARSVLLRAQKFNPVSADARFELAELCKFAHNQEELLRVCQETLPLCTTADRMARVLANMGFYCYVAQDLYSAAVFYFESLRFAPSQPVEMELQDVLRRMKTFGQKFAPPTHGETIDVYEKYGLTPPPNSDLVNLAVTMIGQAKKFNRCAFDLTNDQRFKDEMERLAAEKREERAQNAAPETEA